ncbi:MAG: hypothetical protein FWB83_03785 [Treponema sp.]|nr:hypothetical protein [Treponema sp.]
MKNRIMFLGIVVLMLLVSFGMTGCDEGKDGNPFIGNWAGTDFDGKLINVTITDNSVVILYNSGSSYTGTYTYTGNTATFSVTGMGSGTGTISGNTMIINIQGGQITLTRN